MVPNSLLQAIASQPRLALTGSVTLGAPHRQIRQLMLRYEPVEPRQATLTHLNAAMLDIAVAVNGHVHRDKGQVQRFNFSDEGASFEVQTDFIMRGTLLPIRRLQIDGVELNALAESEAIAELLYLALHRQQPHDLFDAMRVFDGVDESIRKMLVAYIACSPRPIHELLEPARTEIKEAFHMSLQPLLDEPCEVQTLFDFRESLIDWLLQSLDEQDKQFLLSVKRGEAKFDLLPFTHLSELPAMKWKQMNVEKLHAEKQQRILEKLERLFVKSSTGY